MYTCGYLLTLQYTNYHRTMTENEILNGCLLAPFIAYVSGPPLSGKTQFVMELLENKDYLIDPPPDHIVWFYGEETAQLDELKKRGYEIVNGLPASGDFDQYNFPGKNNLFVFDDLMETSGKSKGMTELVTKKCHHQHISVIHIVQDLFHAGTERKTLLRSAHYIVLFRSPLDQTIVQTVAGRVLPFNRQTFMHIYQKATEKPCGYLFLDGSNKSHPDLRFRTDLFGSTQTVFIVKK